MTPRACKQRSETKAPRLCKQRTMMGTCFANECFHVRNVAAFRPERDVKQKTADSGWLSAACVCGGALAAASLRGLLRNVDELRLIIRERIAVGTRLHLLDALKHVLRKDFAPRPLVVVIIVVKVAAHLGISRSRSVVLI